MRDFFGQGLTGAMGQASYWVSDVDGQRGGEVVSIDFETEEIINLGAPAISETASLFCVSAF